jgi:hypothetical protein
MPACLTSLQAVWPVESTQVHFAANDVAEPVPLPARGGSCTGVAAIAIADV